MRDHCIFWTPWYGILLEQPLVRSTTPVQRLLRKIRHLNANRYRRKRSKVDAISTRCWVILVARTRRKKVKKKACPLLDVFACRQVSTHRLYRLIYKSLQIDLLFLKPDLVGSELSSAHPSGVSKKKCILMRIALCYVQS